ncbi:hypothetical protein G9A89_005193 [Geosiphon pyriformis]|nr:hypothetical protein G9A89_005193 [Geosiphon pyriformis]
MEPASLSAGGSGSGLTGLGTQFGTKKKVQVESVYFRGLSYKKPRKPEIAGGVVDLFAGFLPAALLHSGDEECKVSWESKVENDESSMSEVSDVENMANTIAEETSYTEFGDDDKMNKATPRKTRIRTYVLGKSPKAPTFDFMSDDKNVLSLPSPKMFNGSNQMPSVNFDPVKFFALDIEVLAVPEKTNVDKLMAIKKIFYRIDGFGGASTSSKFSGIIRSTFTSELSLGRAKDMAISKKIMMQLIGLWQKALVEFESSEVADLVTSRWSVLMGKDSVHVAKAVNDKQSWVSRNRFWALLYILPIGTTAHDLSELVETYGGKTCFIGRNPTLYVRDQCAVICFESEAFKLAAIGSVLAFKGVGLGSGGHEKRTVTSQNRAQVASSSLPCVVSSGALGVAVLKCSMEILSDQVLLILKKLSFVDLVPLAPLLSALSLVSPTAVVSDMDLGLALDSALSLSASSLPNVGESFVDFSLSSSKILTAKIGSLESNMMALEALICSVLGRLDYLHSGSGLSAFSLSQ